MSEIRPLTEDPLLDELLPYLLDANAPGSRLDVIADKNASAARVERKNKGVFYTPLDVADMMIDRLLKASAIEWPTIVDPACGSGVFLRAFVKRQRAADCSGVPAETILERIYGTVFGIDSSLFAVQSCAFVLLHDVLTKHNLGATTPLQAWKRLRRNLINTSALDVRDRSAATAEELFNNERGRVMLEEVFPQATTGFDMMIANPPYAQLGLEGLAALSDGYFASAKGASTSGNLCVPFVELVWKILHPAGAAALVLPLSLAYHQGGTFRKLRQLIQQDPATWSFAFFDREPHALFGEDVKTRNAIAFRTPLPAGCNHNQIETTRLIRFTSRTRRTVLNSLQFSPLAHFDISNGIPKLEGPDQVRAFQTLNARALQSRERLFERIASVELKHALSAAQNELFVGGTAYSFISVYPKLEPSLANNSVLSCSKLHCLTFLEETARSAAFAILSSRITFWLWLVLGDGFHVSRRFIADSPVLAAVYNQTAMMRLAALGRSLWTTVSQDTVVSRNRGKTTFTFRQYHDHPIKDAIDEVMLNSFGIPRIFGQQLSEAINATLVADPSNVIRSQRFRSAAKTL